MGTVGRSLADGWWMFWQTLWALVLGFALSGAVQAFVNRREMQRLLGDRRPATIAKAGVLGAASSSCSYAASALAKTLFARGADFTTAQAFMFASTNLVVELGVVLWLLIGWQFAAAEFVGGALMLALLRAALPVVVPDPVARSLRQRLAADDVAAGRGVDAAGGRPWRTIRGWADAAAYTISDLTMLRRELVIGFVVAGFADVAVPVSFWRSLFVSGHGFASSLENVVLGPFLAIISFVCSIGNVPLAAALWRDGISFGGVVSFVFADLITLPLLLIYRRYYGTGVTVRLLATFWATMSIAGLACEYAVRLAGLEPTHALHRTAQQSSFGANATTVLDLVALVAFAGLYLLYRNRDRWGDGDRFAKDPVCGMQVERANPGAVSTVTQPPQYFCSDHCKERYESRNAPADSRG